MVSRFCFQKEGKTAEPVPFTSTCEACNVQLLKKLMAGYK
jgi:hypothetical protein